MIEKTSTTWTKGLRFAMALSVVLCLSACGGIHNSINPAGPQAQNISRVWWLMFIVCSIVFVVVMIAVLLSLRNKRNETESAPVLEPAPEQERRRRNVVISAATVTIVVLFVFLIASFF